MALTIKQITSLGFKPTKRGGGLSKYKRYDTYVYPINKTDYLYIGYNPFKEEVNRKTIWKSIMTDEGRLSYQVINIGDTGFSELKDFINRCLGTRMTPPYEEDLLDKEDKKIEPIATVQEVENTMNVIGYATNSTKDNVRQYNS